MAAGFFPSIALQNLQHHTLLLPDLPMLLLCWAGAQGFPGPSACASGAICMLFMMSGILCLSVLPCSVCGIGTLPCSVLLKTPCDYSCGSMTLWGWHTSSWIVLRCLVP